MKKLVYDKPDEGEWVQPARKNYKIACCDCGLVHTVNFRIVKNGRGNFIQFQVFRDQKETNQMRKQEKHICN